MLQPHNEVDSSPIPAVATGPPQSTEQTTSQQNDQPRATHSHYPFNNKGIWWAKTDGEGNIAWRLVTNFTIKSLVSITEDDGAGQRKLCEIMGLLNGKTFGPVTCALDDFERMKWVPDLFGTRGIIFPPERTHAEHAKTAIKLNFPDPPERVVYSATGWYQIDGKWKFLHAGGAIGADGATTEIKASLPHQLRHLCLPVPPEGRELKTAIRASLDILKAADPRITVPLLAAVYRAPIGQAGLSVHANGESGSLKTATSILAQQHFGKAFNAMNLVSWKSTAQFIEEQLFIAKDMLLVVDDFNPRGSRTGIASWHEKADCVFRGIANGAGRGRNNPNGTPQIPHPPRAFALSTGEEVPTGASVNARIVNLPIKREDIDKEVLSQCQNDADAGLYAAAMSGYIRWLASRRDGLLDDVEHRVRELQKAQQGTGSHLRVSENLANLAVGFDYFLQFACEAGAITDQERKQMSDLGWKTLSCLVGTEQNQIQDTEDPAKETIRLLGAAANARKVFFRKLGSAPSASSDAENHYNAKWVGWRENEQSDWLCDPDSLYAAVVALFKEQDTTLAWNKTTLWKRLSSKGYIRSGEKGRNTIRKTIEGKQHYLICIPPETFQRVCEESEGTAVSAPSQHIPRKATVLGA